MSGGEETEKTRRASASDIVVKLQAAGYEAFFVGGCVRDLVRGVEPGDYDIVTSARPEEIRSLFPHTVDVGARFGVLLVLDGPFRHEVATYRTEEDYHNGRHPSRVCFATAEEDVRRRDFTVNGLLLDPFTGYVFDLVGGCMDIDRRLIRTIGDPEQRFAEDRLRMLRAIRFAADLDFNIDATSFAAVRRHAGAIRQISVERVRDELNKILLSRGARKGMELLEETGLLTHILPEVAALRGVEQPEAFHPEGDVWKHVLNMLDHLSLSTSADPDPCLAWAVLLHDIGKPLTRFVDCAGIHFYGHSEKGRKMAASILKRLKFPKAQTETIIELIAGHMMFMGVQNMRSGRLKRFLRQQDFDLHLELHRLDCLGSHGFLDNYMYCIDKLRELSADMLHPVPLLTGHDLLARGYRPGPLFRKILQTVEEAQLNGEVRTKEEAEQLVVERFALS